MIGTNQKIKGQYVTLVNEHEHSSCQGCVFHNEDQDECVISGEETLTCGEHYAVYKKIDLQKGLKKKLTLN